MKHKTEPSYLNNITTATLIYHRNICSLQLPPIRSCFTGISNIYVSVISNFFAIMKDLKYAKNISFCYKVNLKGKKGYRKSITVNVLLSDNS